MTRLLVILSTLALPAIAQAETGRYTAVANGSGVGVWVVDTASGEAKYCTPQRNSDGATTVLCTDFGE